MSYQAGITAAFLGPIFIMLCVAAILAPIVERYGADIIDRDDA